LCPTRVQYTRMDRALFSEEFSELIIDADGSLVSAAAGCAKHLTATCHNARAEGAL